MYICMSMNTSRLLNAAPPNLALKDTQRVRRMIVRYLLIFLFGIPKIT